jgi:hypothetical protein
MTLGLAVGAVALLVLGGVALWWPRPGGGPPEPLRAEVTVRIHSPDRPADGAQVGKDAIAVPVREDDQMRVVARLNQPAYVYVLWVDGAGTVLPLYPWNVDRVVVKTVTAPPPARPALTQLHSPETLSQGWPLDNTPGLETILVLVRREPWPEGRSLAELLGQVVPAPVRERNEVVIRAYRHGQEMPSLALDDHRGSKGDAQTIDNQLLQVVQQLKNDFDLIHAVRFAHVAK